MQKKIGKQTITGTSVMNTLSKQISENIVKSSSSGNNKRRTSSERIIGNRASEIKTVKRKGHFHVYRLNSDTTGDLMLQHLTKTAPDIPFECEELKRNNL